MYGHPGLVRFASLVPSSVPSSQRVHPRAEEIQQTHLSSNFTPQDYLNVVNKIFCGLAAYSHPIQCQIDHLSRANICQVADSCIAFDAAN
jgi:hypothetical protein